MVLSLNTSVTKCSDSVWEKTPVKKDTFFLFFFHFHFISNGIFLDLTVFKLFSPMTASIWARPGGLPVLRTISGMGDEGSPEVTSSSASPTGVVAAVLSGSLISPAHSLGSSDIGEVDLEFWDLDLNAHHTRVMAPLKITTGHGPCSDTSGSISGTHQDELWISIY